jgi:DNA-binding response OmpR family regulator
VLIIDDSDLIRMAAEIALSADGWTVLEAASGEEGVEVAGRERPDVILLDVVLPGRDGRETLGDLRRVAGLEAIPIVFLTARSQEAEVAELRSLGARGVIAKPFVPAELAAELSGILAAEEG